MLNGGLRFSITFYADPDPSLHFDADPAPYQSDANPQTSKPPYRLQFWAPHLHSERPQLSLASLWTSNFELWCESGSLFSLWFGSCSLSKWCESSGFHNLQGFIFEPYISIVSVHGPPWLRCEPLHTSWILSFDANPDPDPAFQSDADPELASQNYADPLRTRIRNPGWIPSANVCVDTSFEARKFWLYIACIPFPELGNSQQRDFCPESINYLNYVVQK